MKRQYEVAAMCGRKRKSKDQNIGRTLTEEKTKQRITE
jgi:hypothetical protein